MSVKRRYVLVLFVGLIASLGVVYFWVRDVGEKYFYATYFDVKKDSSVQAASVPDFVPESATDISGWYNVEINDSTIEFRYSASDLDKMVEGFEIVRGTDAEIARHEILRYKWKGLNKGANFSFYEKNDQGCVAYLATDSDLSRAFFADRCAAGIENRGQR